MPESTPIRLAEWLGCLTLAADTANGFPQEKVLRTVLIASAVARRMGMSGEALRLAWWAPMLRYLGCTGFAHEEAHRYGAGDDRATRNTMVLADEGAPLEGPATRGGHLDRPGRLMGGRSPWRQGGAPAGRGQPHRGLATTVSPFIALASLAAKAF